VLPTRPAMFGQHPLDRLKALRCVRVLRHVCPRIVFEAGWVMSLNFVALWDQPHATLSVIERKSS
jgi:hypothetical protein